MKPEYEKRIDRYGRSPWMYPWIPLGLALILFVIALLQFYAATSLARIAGLSSFELFELWIRGFSPTERYLGVVIRAVGQMALGSITVTLALCFVAVAFHMRFLSVLAKDYQRLRQLSDKINPPIVCDERTPK